MAMEYGSSPEEQPADHTLMRGTPEDADLASAGSTSFRKCSKWWLSRKNFVRFVVMALIR